MTGHDASNGSRRRILQAAAAAMCGKTLRVRERRRRPGLGS